jgi:hypothetical protein
MEIYSEALAKMFATENIAIQIKNSPTAYFDVENRRMTFPKWILQLPVASRELLMLHEASHALHTPEIGTHDAVKEYEQVFRSIINILEDKRIEDLMKKKFPGSKATFTRGFFELVNTNMFGIHFDDDMSEMNLLDRMNLHFKGDYYFEPEFEEKEQYWVDRAANNKTFDEVYQNAIELYEYLKDNHTKEVLENIKWELGEISDGETGTHQSWTMDELEDLLSEEDFQKLQEVLQQGNDQRSREIIKETLKDYNLDFAEENASKTEQEWEKSQERMQRKNQESSLREIINTSFSKKLNSNDFIVSNDIITETIQTDMSHIGLKVKGEFETFIRDHKQEMSPILSHMVREFYRKKAAEDFRRTQQSKTGNLDLKKLSRYKFDSDLFLNKSIVKDEKNHGFVLLVDWSVSMNYIMTNAILQLVNNVMFCKAINVPFVAYAFSSEANKTHDSPMRLVYHATEDSDMRISSDLKLLELFDSTKSNYDQQLRNLFYLAFSFHTHRRTNRQEFKSFEQRLNSMNEDQFKRSYERDWAKERKNEMFVLSDLFDLGGTPLNDSLLLMNYILPKRQKEMNVSVLNLVVITDGDSNYSDRIAGELETELRPYSPETIETLPDQEKPKAREYLRECNVKVRTADRHKERICPEPNSTYIRSLYSNKIYNLNKPTQYDVFNAHNNGRKITRNIAHIIKQDTNANVICIELMTTSSASFRRNLIPWFGVYDENEIETYATDYRKNGFCVIPNLGYDQIFVVDLNKVGNQKYNENFYRSNMSYDEVDHFEDLEAKDEGKGLTTRQLKTALNKNQSLKNNRKFMASRLVDIMSEYQSVVEKKKRIELALDITLEE